MQSRVVYDSQEYVVISKPPGVPVAPTVDNVLECTLTGAAQVHPSAAPISRQPAPCHHGTAPGVWCSCLTVGRHACVSTSNDRIA